MKIEIWSDIMCPFCYIGKRKFEVALAQFSHKDKLEIEWKSFQLMPDLKNQTDRNLDQFLADEKGLSLEQAKAMNSQVLQMAKQVGLHYNFDKVIPVNTFKAHQFIHFAKTNGKQDEAEEILFHAFFVEGENIDEISTLAVLGKTIGLSTETLITSLENETYADAVRVDMYEANQVGVRGVPFFVFNEKYAISGAQNPEAFLQVLNMSFSEWSNETAGKKPIILEGQSCASEGACD